MDLTSEELLRDLAEADRRGDTELAGVIAAQIKQLENPPEPVQAPPERNTILQKTIGGIQDFSEGIGVSGLKTYYGMKDLLGLGQESDRDTLKSWQDAAGESGWGMGGEIVGDVAQMAIPGGAAAKIGKAGSVLKNTMATDMAASTALGYAQLPGEDQTRMGNATTIAAGTAGGYGMGKAVGSVFQGIKGTPAAERLRAMGAKLTPGEMKEGFTRGVENYLSYFMPSVSKAIQKAQAASKDSIRVALIRESAPPTPQSIATGKFEKAKPNSVRELVWAYDEAYDAAWPAVSEMAPRTVGRVLYRGLQSNAKLTTKERAIVGDAIDEISSVMASHPNPSAAKVDSILRNAIRPMDTGEWKDVNAVFNNMRQDLKDGLPEINKSALKMIDKGYGKRKAIGNAARLKRAFLKRGEFDQKDLASGSKMASSERQQETRTGNLQREVEDWAEIIGEPPGMLMTMARRAVQMIPDLSYGGQKKVMDVIAGNYGWQGKAREILRDPGMQGLTRTMSAGKIGAAQAKQYKQYLEEEEQ